MSDPITALDQAHGGEQIGPWTARLVLFLRIMAAISMLKGLYHWSAIIGAWDAAGSGFETNPTPWKAATIFFAVIDLVAAVGLWLAAAWGGVVWLTAAISMAAVELFFPQIYGGHVGVAFIELGVILVYVALAVLASRERPP